ncbi:hypothetical protein ABTZ58_33220 [Streptomyces sp. NPDC094143]|uniref:hypothetical protein n=1 Tax=Streptomyces sp. NPDC094143 TaxID=3155310 RepID=UPI00332D2208
MIISVPSAASRVAERLTVVARGTTNKITFRSWTEGSGWADWQDLGGPLAVPSHAGPGLGTTARGRHLVALHQVPALVLVVIGGRPQAVHVTVKETGPGGCSPPNGICHRVSPAMAPG